jgi:hypothetical protein
MWHCKAYKKVRGEWKVENQGIYPHSQAMNFINEQSEIHGITRVEIIYKEKK